LTLAIAAASADGVAIAADSRTTTQYGGSDKPTRVLSDFTHKVFEVGQAAVATYGWAFLEGRNIAGHMADLQTDPAVAALPVEQLAHRLAEFFGEAYDRHLAAGLDSQPPEGWTVLGFLIGGYLNGVGHVYEVRFPGRTVDLLFDTATNPGAAWRGQTDVIVRLVKGVDLDLLTARAMAQGKQAQLAELDDELGSLEYVIPFQAMNLQDAVDFAAFAIRTTIDTQRLTYGTRGDVGSWPGVGGPIEIAVVTPKAGLAWIQKTNLQGERRAGEAEFS
jgi:20S proteasome alpha/beta subunit